MGGAASILFWCAAVRRPQAWSARRSGALAWARPSAATPAGAGGWGRWGARFAGPAASPPPLRRGPFWGRGGVPSAPGGRRVAPVALKLGGGSGEGGVGGPPPRPPAPSGVGLPSVVSGVPPKGLLVPWGLPGGRGRRARPGRPPMGQCGGGGGRGGEPRRPRSRPRLPCSGGSPERRGRLGFAVGGSSPPKTRNTATPPPPQQQSRTSGGESWDPPPCALGHELT